MTSFHGFSPILVFIFWVCFLFYRNWNLPISAIFNKDLTLSLSLFLFWILITSIAFIGDNGRPKKGWVQVACGGQNAITNGLGLEAVDGEARVERIGLVLLERLPIGGGGLAIDG